MSSQHPDVSYRHPSSILSFADNALTLVREAVLTAGYEPLTTLAKKAVVSVLQNISVGRLRIVTSEYTYEFPERIADGDREDKPHAELRVVNDAFWVRLCMMGDLGFAEAYMFGDVLCEDLISTFLVFLKNKEKIASLNSTLTWLFSLPQRLTSFRLLNSLGNARFNISAHYDLSDGMFKAFLSEDMTYSCAIFSDLDGDLRKTPLLAFSNNKLYQLLTPSPSPETTSDPNTPTSHTRQPLIHANLSYTPTSHTRQPLIHANLSYTPTSHTQSTPPAETLVAAQQRKLAHIVSRARIFPGHRVLEIGSGWGSLALHIVRHIREVQIDTITLSENQHAHVCAEVTRQGFEDRIHVHLLDYREMPREWDSLFDRVVSIEMVENVGLDNMDAYFSAIDRVLKRKNAMGVIQSSTIPNRVSILSRHDHVIHAAVTETLPT